MIISASILAANLLEIGADLKRVKSLGVQRIHLDVMDNHYVPNLSFGLGFCQALKSQQPLPVEVHLMTQPVESTVVQALDAQADWIIFHPETTKSDCHKIVELIRSSGSRVGLALHPNLSLEWLDQVTCQIDQLLVMTVVPGFSGQSFMDHSLNRIKAARRWIDQTQTACELAVDGGVGPNNLLAIADCGVDVAVIGSALFSGDIQQNTLNIKHAMDSDAIY